MFGRESRLGKKFLESAGIKLRQVFRESSRDEGQCCDKIFTSSAGILYHTGGYTAQETQGLPIELKSQKAVQALLHAFLLDKKITKLKTLSINWQGVEDSLPQFISLIQEGYREPTARALKNELKFYAERSFAECARRNPSYVPAFRVPLQGGVDFRVVPAQITDSGSIVSVTISSPPTQNWLQKFISAP